MGEPFASCAIRAVDGPIVFDRRHNVFTSRHEVAVIADANYSFGLVGVAFELNRIDKFPFR